MTTWYEIFWQYLLGDGPICSLKSLSNMMYGQTSDRYVEKDGELFLKCYISGVPMAHWLQLFNQSIENLFVDSKFSMNVLRMAIQ